MFGYLEFVKLIIGTQNSLKWFGIYKNINVEVIE